MHANFINNKTYVGIVGVVCITISPWTAKTKMI